MEHNGFDYWLTKHGRSRFKERVDPHCHDGEILKRCITGIPGYKVVWGQDYKNPFARRLVTVLFQAMSPVHYQRKEYNDHNYIATNTAIRMEKM